jgi:hypothetical protein
MSSTIRSIALWVFLSVWSTGCNIFDRWDAIVYPNRFNRDESLDLGTFSSLEACRAASLAKLKELKIHTEIGGYICGRNCMVQMGFGNMRMCAETSQ